MHYAKAYKKRIAFLEAQVKAYYFAVRFAKKRAGIKLGVSGISSLEGSEESPAETSAAALRGIIADLPEKDCGVQG